MNKTTDTRACPVCGNFTATFTARKKDGWRCPCGAKGTLIKTSLGNDYMAVLERPAQTKEKTGG